MTEYDGATSDDDEEYNGQNYDEYSSGEDHDDEDDEDVDDEEEEDQEEQRPVSSRKHEHQLEWDEGAVEYGPKKV